MVGDQIFDVLHDIVIGITYAINDIIASEEVFRLSPERRKCLIQSESRSKYFSVRQFSIVYWTGILISNNLRYTQKIYAK